MTQRMPDGKSFRPRASERMTRGLLFLEQYRWFVEGKLPFRVMDSAENGLCLENRQLKVIHNVIQYV